MYKDDNDMDIDGFHVRCYGHTRRQCGVQREADHRNRDGEVMLGAQSGIDVAIYDERRWRLCWVTTAPAHEDHITGPGGEYTITVKVTPEAGVGTNAANVETYTIKVTRSADEMSTLLSRYDADGDGEIGVSEVSAAIDDFLDGLLDVDEVSAVIDLFLQ